ncbi:protein BREAST CANCER SUSCEPTIBILITY 2 homolog B isoform X2 [Dendrobium catenatum]|nr:protein BREAST CANCER SUSCEPTIBILITY 2 homolog B isoform X2 [Dendrobium catenatum]
MTARSEPTTWRILRTKGGQFRWAVTSGDRASVSERPPKTLVLEEDDKHRSRLPSMMDLMFHVEQTTWLSNKSSFLDQQLAIPPKPGGVGGDKGTGGAMFSTGSGRTLSVQQSSIQKARSLLEEGNVADEASCGSECFPMFRTGSGKSVQVRESSIKKAATLLEVTNDKEGNLVCKDALPDHSMHELRGTRWSRSACPPLKFHTAGGQSISISADALKHARNLLNDLESEAIEDEAKENALSYSTYETNKINNESSCNVKRVGNLHDGIFMNKAVFEISSSVKQFRSPLMAPITSSSFPNHVDSKPDHHSNNNDSCSKPPNKELSTSHTKVPYSRMIRASSSVQGEFVDISNYANSSMKNKSWINGKKKRLGMESSSSFKKPRTSKFSTSNNSSSSLAATALPSSSVNCCCRTRVSSRYPFQGQRKKLKEFFGAPPGRTIMFENIPDRVRCMTPDNAEKYRFRDTCSSIEFAPEAFKEMLLQSGALLADISEKWVVNHYKWIVWKLACLERCYPCEAIGKFLTVSNVLEELKYRYEREVNYGHRSALRKILDGDVSPSSMMILCVSAIRSHSGLRTDEVLGISDLHEYGNKVNGVGCKDAVKIELTDGWYSLDTTLDGYLSKLLLAGKLFVGQKIRVCGATLCGWVEPISPLEASNSVSLVLHINGAYRAHWADSLGFCKGIGAPLAFRCIKGGGGKVPRTLVGIMRLYPILYKERLPDGGSIVRSENLEKKILQLNSRRRSDIAEDIISEFEDAPVNFNDNEEGAKLFRILESSAETEVLMAGMSLEQLTSFSSYQEKQEALRQADLHKKIEKALEEAGLGSRDVTPFMRVRVIGLTRTDSSKKSRPREGMITIWNPTEKQKLELVEGQIYSVSWLAPFCGRSDFLYLQSRGPSSEWVCLPAADSEKYESFFIPRKSVSLSNLGEVPLTSEFDISAVVVYVGKAYLSGCQRKQWIFVTDGSECICNSFTEDEHDSLLAISFCSPILDNDSLAPINQCLSGNAVGFCNLIKRARDRNNDLWVAEATENSTYSINCNISGGSHLKGAADSALKWAKTSSMALKKLEEKVLSITGDHGV